MISWIYEAATILLALILIFLTFRLGKYLEHKKHSQSLKQLQNQLERLMRQDYTVKFDKFSEGELAVFACQLELVVKRTQSAISSLNSEKLAQSQNLIDISHQLKTPLAAQLTYLEMLEQGENDSAKKQQLGKCIFLTEKMTLLVKRLLEFARLENTATDFQFTQGDIVEMLDNCLLTVKEYKHSSPISATLNCPRKIYCRFNEYWLSQAVVNILKNGVDYGGEPPVLIVNAVENDSTVIISIKDNGKGISQEDLPFIFNRFYRAKGSKSEGLGIGLALAKEVVERHHGNLRATSDNEGTLFIITLPKLNMIEKI